MKYLNFSEEKKLWKQGIEVVVGLDEAGRGPLAGPVVAAAVSISRGRTSGFKKVNDSKKLNEKQREEIYELLINHKDIKWGIGVVSEKVIDKINILQASKLAMQKAVEDLILPKVNGRPFLGKNTFLLIDGNFKINSEISQKAIVKGDQKVFSIAAASIIAKVTRDRIMQKMHKKYPQYGFHLHKGYGTPLHLKVLHQFGPCPIHRKTFYPVSKLNSVDLK